MVSSLKCAQCGLVNFPNETTCKRCRSALVVSSGPLGIVLADGYVLPPPPNVGMGGIWRDKAVMVMSRDAMLPDRCVKCNVPTTGRLKRKLTWHHPALYLTILVAWLLYLIIALVVRKTATLEVGLCDEHRAKRKRKILFAWSLLALGLAGLLLAAILEDGTTALLGVAALLVAFVFGVMAVRILTPSKIDDRFVWLRGVHKDYLNELPQWVGG